MFYSFEKPSRSFDTWVWWDDVFTTRQLDIIQDIAKHSTNIGQINGGDRSMVINKTDYRRSHVTFIENEPEVGWIRDILGNFIKDVNNKYFKYDLTGLEEPIQLSNYKHDFDGGYEWHMDCDPSGNLPVRKLSLTLQLTDPSEYIGGDLELMLGDPPLKMERKRGRIIVFPSWVRHRVTPVTSGERQSLVQWVTGPLFK
jgi:PKHD-type hydroxylase